MSRLFSALLVTLLFAVLGVALRGVTLSGAAAGFAVAFILYSCLGPGAFVVLFAVFAITWMSTRLGYARKQRLGLAEKRSGRSAPQVAANLAVSAICAVVFWWTQQHWAVVAAVAGLAEVACDTTSSECGQAWSQSAYLVTGFRAVPAGTNGAVSLAGTSAGILAALITSGTAIAAKVLTPRGGATVLIAAILGGFIDSLLGATLERRGLLDNNRVNFLGALSAAAIAALLA